MDNHIKARITKRPSNVHTATAKDATGKPIIMCPVENILVINGFAVDPKATPSEVDQAGDAITAEATKTARLEGVSKIWIVVSDEYKGSDARYIRVVEEKLPQDLPTQRIGCYSPIPPVTYLN
jgi:hypothetical protein